MTFTVRTAKNGHRCATVEVFGTPQASLLVEGVAALAVEVAEESGAVAIELYASTRDGRADTVEETLTFERSRALQGLGMRVQVVASLYRFLWGWDVAGPSGLATS